MFRKEPKPEDVALDAAILRLLREMDEYGPETPEYRTCLEHLDKLNEIRRGNTRSKVSMDTVVQAGAGLLGVVAIIAYEQKHVMASKAMNLIGKTKL